MREPQSRNSKSNKSAFHRLIIPKSINYITIMFPASFSSTHIIPVLWLWVQQRIRHGLQKSPLILEQKRPLLLLIVNGLARSSVFRWQGLWRNELVQRSHIREVEVDLKEKKPKIKISGTAVRSYVSHMFLPFTAHELKDEGNRSFRQTGRVHHVVVDLYGCHLVL